MIAVDGETASIEHLDFDPPCEAKPVPVEHGADFHIRCRACGTCTLLCREHLEWWKRLMKRWEAKKAAIVCVVCDHRSRTFDEAAEVRPL